MTHARRISIVIPTLRERDIAQALGRLTAYLERLRGRNFEIVVVDDSPEESFRAEVKSFADCLRGNSTLRVLAGKRRGKGDANRIGVLASSGDIVFTIDADLPVPLQHIDEFLGLLEVGAADVVTAERPMAHNLDQPLRFILSRGLFVLQRVFVFPSDRFLDTQCGFKAYRGDLIRRIAKRQVVQGGMCDVEYLYAARAQGMKVARVRVVPNPERRESRIRVWRCMVTDPFDLARILMRGLQGRYGPGDS